jgi:hypothetical protein
MAFWQRPGAFINNQGYHDIKKLKKNIFNDSILDIGLLKKA